MDNSRLCSLDCVHSIALARLCSLYSVTLNDGDDPIHFNGCPIVKSGKNRYSAVLENRVVITAESNVRICKGKIVVWEIPYSSWPILPPASNKGEAYVQINSASDPYVVQLKLESSDHYSASRIVLYAPIVDGDDFSMGNADPMSRLNDI